MDTVQVAKPAKSAKIYDVEGIRNLLDEEPVPKRQDTLSAILGTTSWAVVNGIILSPLP